MDTPSLGPELFCLGWTIAGPGRDKAPVGPTSNLLPQRVLPASPNIGIVYWFPNSCKLHPLLPKLGFPAWLQRPE